MFFWMLGVGGILKRIFDILFCWGSDGLLWYLFGMCIGFSGVLELLMNCIFGGFLWEVGGLVRGCDCCLMLVGEEFDWVGLDGLICFVGFRECVVWLFLVFGVGGL